MEIKGLNFVCTCRICPEQYDVYDSDGRQVGYVRLRWGALNCEYPNVFGECIYHASVGDGFTGCFEDEEQRMMYLSDIADRIREKLNNAKCMSDQPAEEDTVYDDNGNPVSGLDDDYTYWEEQSRSLTDPLSDDYCKYDNE